MNNSSRWPESKVLIALLAATFLGLFFDLRYDHNNVVQHTNAAWIPIYYSGIMVVSCLAGLAAWERGGRQALVSLFALGIVVGCVGYWQHNGDELVGAIVRLFSVWTGAHPDPTARPPILAPLTFAGLGAVGLYACLRTPRRCGEPDLAAGDRSVAANSRAARP